jgi:tetratricopeptide (TPR) repeat protein
MLLRGRRLDAAIAAYREVLEVAPRPLLEVHARLGALEHLGGRPSACREHMQAGLDAWDIAWSTREHPSDGDLLEMRALALLLLGDTERAFETLDRAVAAQRRLTTFDSVRHGVYELLGAASDPIPSLDRFCARLNAGITR